MALAALDAALRGGALLARVVQPRRGDGGRRRSRGSLTARSPVHHTMWGSAAKRSWDTLSDSRYDHREREYPDLSKPRGGSRH
eukprot:scaffold105426_cov56-Phaeocystis_antarctica.AAC.3